MLKPDEEQSFFDRERDRLTGEIATVCAFYCHRDHVYANPQASFLLFFSFSFFTSSGVRRTIIEQ